MNRSDLAQANAAQSYTVTAGDLPLACPMPNMTLWNSHPRVYLPIEDTGKATCPYCGALFTLETGA
ncbi:MAG: zinc-finger domain-containing protein [Chromatiales bacterium]|nr:zinc-finger domain-containing protein [Chromatiales bacterium]